jgi:hypothetical protein
MFGSDVFLRSVVLGAVVIGVGSAASAMTVTRCNQLIDGAFRTVIIVNHNGEKSVHPLGEDGLTRRIAYDARAAVAWASSKYGDDDVSFGDCTVDIGRDFDLVADIGDDDSGGYDNGYDGDGYDGDGTDGGGETGGGETGGGETGGGETGGGETGGGETGGGETGGGDTGGGETGGGETGGGETGGGETEGGETAIR